MEQLRARAYGTDELALVAGYDSSGDSERPGFGWFFGRDSLYSIYAIDGYGDFSIAKSELEFLIHRQSAAGKIIHEYSQTAAAVDWQATPFEYAAADSTPLFLLAVEDYVRSSGDVGFLTANRAAIEKAWAFETDPAHDTDHDGIYDNSQGTGWVESWPNAMPHQEIYLALLDQQASAAMAKIEKQLGNAEGSAAAEQRAAQVAATIEREYYDKEKGCYAFSHNTDGSQDRTSSVYPALAWWDPDGKPALAHGDECLRQLAEHTLNTDWGLRDISNEEKIYDGASYHQGSVWPLFTGWAALAEYRGGQPLVGYQMLMENANLTWAQDLGADTEWLSGDFYVPMPSSTSHQLWSSAMVITPTLRGLFGISIDAGTKTITVNPRLPAFWDHADVKNIEVPGGALNLFTSPEGEFLRVSLRESGVDGWSLRTGFPDAKRDKAQAADLLLPLEPVQVSLTQSSTILPGSRTEKPRILRENWLKRSLTLSIEGPAGSSASYLLTHKDSKHLALGVSDGLSNHAEGRLPGALLVSLGMGDPVITPDSGSALLINFPPGEGWKTIMVTLTW
jgi:glycogen debranching enzyme